MTAANTESERAQHPRVAWGSIAAGVLLLAGSILALFIVPSGAPSVSLLRATAPALMGARATGPSPRTADVAFINDNAWGFILAAALSAAGTALLALPLRHLYLATKARRPETPSVGLVLGTWGPLVGALATVVFQVVYQVRVHSFVHQADHSQHAVDQINSSAPLVLAQVLNLASHFAIAFALVVIPLNAMRTGLLTRFMGVLGIISGILFVLVQLSPLPVVQAFWLVALGALFSGRGPQPLPPAWEAGVAVPWPSQQEMREGRSAAPASAGASSVPAPAPAPAAPGPNAAKKRKKRRR